MVVLVIGIMGCASGSEWADVRREFNYRPPAGINFVVIPRTQGRDLDEAIRHLTADVTKALADQGVAARPLAYPGVLPVLYLEIVEWDPGNRFARWWGFGGGEAHMLIETQFVRMPAAPPALMGTIRAFVRGGTFGGSAMEAPELAATSIARFVATGAPPESDL